MRPFRPLAAVLLAAAVSTAAAAQTPPDAGSGPVGPPQNSTSNYSDGTGDSAVDALNDSQLNNNYRGPRYLVQPGTSRPLDGGPPPPATAPYAVSPYPATRPAYPSGPAVVAPPPPRPPSVPTAPSPATPSAIYPAGPPG